MYVYAKNNKEITNSNILKTILLIFDFNFDSINSSNCAENIFRMLFLLFFIV